MKKQRFNFATKEVIYKQFKHGHTIRFIAYDHNTTQTRIKRIIKEIGGAEFII